jgi:vacuolar-type H+-ATPase subunit E/Vma4
MTDVLAPVKTARTTTPTGTFVEAEHTLADGVLLYRPEDNAFIALYPDEWLACRADGHAKKTAIEELQEANRDVTAKSLALHDLLQQPNPAKAELAAARKELDKALDNLDRKSEAAKKHVELIANQKSDPNKIVELLPLTLKRIDGPKHTPIYVSADKLKTAMADKRVYLVDGAAERKKEPKQKLFDGAKLNTGELKKRILNNVQDKAKFSVKWKLAPKDEDHFSGILTDWAKVMGPKATEFLERGHKEIMEGIIGKENTDPNNPYRMVDLKSEAQFMRWTAGAAIEANFMPLQGNANDMRDLSWSQRFKRLAKTAQFGIKANADASFNVGAAKVETVLYLPHAAGWHLDPCFADQPLDFGYFRLRGNLSLFALAGASIALEAGTSLLITGDKQGLKGTPKNERGAKAKAGSKGEAEVFIGLKEGIALVGALQWLNPEGMLNPGVPKKADLNKAIAAYVDVAEVHGDGSLIEGLAAKNGFECDYRQGYFVIAAKASRCLGMGGECSVAGKVGIEQIGKFFMCIAHQLKQANYRKLTGVMKVSTFATLNQIFFLLNSSNQKIESFVGISAGEIAGTYEKALLALRNHHESTVHGFVQKLESGWGWHAYLPPESRGALIRTLVDAVSGPKSFGNEALRTSAAFAISELLSTVQSAAHLYNTLDRITTELGNAPGRSFGAKLIESVVGGTTFANCIQRSESVLTKSAPLLGRPFLRNDDAQFAAAQLPLQHPGYGDGSTGTLS